MPAGQFSRTLDPPCPSPCSRQGFPPASRTRINAPPSTYGHTAVDDGHTANSYCLRDFLGSTIGLTDGSRTASYLYDPYGQTTSSSGTAAAANPFRYAGGYQDPNGQVRGRRRRGWWRR